MMPSPTKESDRPQAVGIASMPTLEPGSGAPTLETAETLTTEPNQETPEAKPLGWTPEVAKILVSGLWGVLVAFRGPHWALTDEETDPLWEPTTFTLNHTPGLKDVAPEHVAIAVTVAGWGAIAAKRAGWDRAIAQQQKAEDSMHNRPAREGESASPYGPNRTQ